MNIKEGIRAVRKDLGLKQSEVAEKLGIKVSVYSNYETGRRIPPISRVDSIAGAMGVSPLLIYVKSLEKKDIPLNKSLPLTVKAVYNLVKQMV